MVTGPRLACITAQLCVELCGSGGGPADLQRLDGTSDGGDGAPLPATDAYGSTRLPTKASKNYRTACNMQMNRDADFATKALLVGNVVVETLLVTTEFSLVSHTRVGLTHKVDLVLKGVLDAGHILQTRLQHLRGQRNRKAFRELDAGNGSLFD